MKDPLTKYDWNKLYNDYDSHCKRFDPNSIYLEYFKSRPASDRECYYFISKEIKIIFESIKNNSKQYFPIKLLIAILYWKLYSQPAAVKNICHKLYNDISVQTKTSAEFNKYVRNLPLSVAKNIITIVNLVKKFNDYKIHGASSATSLPVRTTILHFIYPNEISIFDKMVLQAVGINKKNANQDIIILKEYQNFAWSLAQKYNDKIKTFSESPLRVIDMALWINR
ncbi:MAG: hypothetical protein N2171_08080 [Clostridia bacterium]|nr:hypothetical protein [Clostridia bacterium]